MIERQVKQRLPDRLQEEEIVQIAQRIPRIWKEVANLTKLFEAHEIDNITYGGGGEDESHKVRTMLNRYTEKGGTRQTLVHALEKLKMSSLSKDVLFGSFIRDQ